MSKAPKGYRLEPDDRNRCEHCGHGRMWDIVGPDDCALSTSYEDEGEAQDVADDLNAAYEMGKQVSADKVRA